MNCRPICQSSSTSSAQPSDVGTFCSGSPNLERETGLVKVQFNSGNSVWAVMLITSGQSHKTFFKSEPTPASFLFIFVLFKHNFTEKLYALARFELGSSEKRRARWPFLRVWFCSITPGYSTLNSLYIPNRTPEISLFKLCMKIKSGNTQKSPPFYLCHHSHFTWKIGWFEVSLFRNKCEKVILRI